MTDKEFEELFPKFEKSIRDIANAQAKGNTDLADDLYSEGLITFWKLDISKAKTNTNAWVRKAVRNRMVDYLRKQRLRSTESLNTLISLGGQVTEDQDTGEPVLLRRTPKQRDDDVDEWSNSRADRAFRIIEEG